jgi:uncharacterized protein YjeT (DUF2065 family)
VKVAEIVRGYVVLRGGDGEDALVNRKGLSFSMLLRPPGAPASEVYALFGADDGEYPARFLVPGVLAVERGWVAPGVLATFSGRATEERREAEKEQLREGAAKAGPDGTPEAGPAGLWREMTAQARSLTAPLLRMAGSPQALALGAGVVVLLAVALRR